jgi:putative endonuclease
MDGMEAGEMTDKRTFEKRALRDGRPPTGREPHRRRQGASRMPTGRRTAKQLAGATAENIAADFLRAKGLEILERNYLRRLGELDIVARDGDILVIAEVRTRASNRYGGAAASVDPRKQQRIIRAASQLLQQRKDLARLRVRFDVIAVLEMDRETPRVDWIQHAFLT